ncbi:alpha/beta fold hydrolase [Actinokineospora bangkokensis]|uniref:Alpha/beta hydrolase n=1 Tax=Actinokineospora bangkokensis TaxID=1193682 RepID=A0A1Q9LS21_9PSEU|nr:alpha/beta fold hydrolase [Actinokineospora bangkokensis]OLR94822.1 alpha/beta hydrolase [Actinokineospora bangkokensis]
MRTLEDLAAALLDAAPLLAELPAPVRVACPDPGAAAALGKLTAALGLPDLVPVPDGTALGPFERVLSAHLDLAAEPVHDGDPVAAAAKAAESDFDGQMSTVDLTVPGALPWAVRTAGDPRDPAVLICPPCGMPARLLRGWVSALARERFVIVPDPRLGPGPAGTTAQVDDLLAALDAVGARRAHLLGLCGGAVLAVLLAHRDPARVSSLSLWHGDFDLGDEAPKTDHQRNLVALMAVAARDAAKAASVHAVLAHTMLGATPPHLAHLVLLPYARPDLLHHYCTRNGAIMAADLRPHLDLPHPTLVVTSTDDATAHPDGSRAVAARLPAATLRVLPHGDHLSLFRAEPHVLDLALGFLRAQDPPPGRPGGREPHPRTTTEEDP